MKGGKRSNTLPPGRDTVRSLLPTGRNNIINALERMDQDERFELYKEVRRHEDRDNIVMFEEIFGEHYPQELALAKRRMLDVVASSGNKSFVIRGHRISVGGKTRRKHHRRGHRGRRSLKHHGKRR